MRSFLMIRNEFLLEIIRVVQNCPLICNLLTKHTNLVNCIINISSNLTKKIFIDY